MTSKKLTAKQMFDLVEYLTNCFNYYEDEYSLNAVNSTLKILGYDGEFTYVSVEDAIRYDGGIAQQGSE